MGCGHRKFICAECGEATYFKAYERARAKRLMCRWCGSYSLDPSQDSKVKDEIIMENRRLVHDYIPDSIVRSITGSKRKGTHHKVV